MKRSILIFVIVIIMMSGSASFVFAGTELGGHIRVTLFDYVDGVHLEDGESSFDTQYTGFGMTAIVLFLYHQLSDNVSVTLQPMFKAITGATPQLGMNIGEQKSEPSGVTLRFAGVEWGRATVKWVLPYGFELTAGILKPKFTMEYGAELF